MDTHIKGERDSDSPRVMVSGSPGVGSMVERGAAWVGGLDSILNTHTHTHTHTTTLYDTHYTTHTAAFTVRNTSGVERAVMKSENSKRMCVLHKMDAMKVLLHQFCRAH